MTLFSRPTTWASPGALRACREEHPRRDRSTCRGDLPEDLLDLNPYHTVPTLVDRDLVLYDSRVIIEYLDERFPHPPLMPVDPVARAQFRLALYRIERDWYSLAQQIDDPSDRKNGSKARKILRDSILASSRRVQSQAVLPVGRVFTGGCHHRTDPVAPVVLGNRSASAGPAHHQVRQQSVRRPSFRDSLSRRSRK